MLRPTITAIAALCAGLYIGASSASGLAAGQYVTINDDVDLYYEEAGEGAPLVLVPGWTASAVVFEHQFDHFSKSHHVVVYDPRSQGLSTRTLEHNNYAQHGRDLATLIDKLGLKHVS